MNSFLFLIKLTVKDFLRAYKVITKEFITEMKIKVKLYKKV